MKTPEEYFKESGKKNNHLGQFNMSQFKKNNRFAYETTIEALKSMQEDHEKELIEFAKWYSGSGEEEAAKAVSQWKLRIRK